MKIDRRSFLSFIIGGAAGTALSPLPWKLTDDISIWTQNWPWTQRATLTDKPRDPGSPDITISFDPRTLLPSPLNQKKISILDDSGSSVLLQLH